MGDERVSVGVMGERLMNGCVREWRDERGGKLDVSGGYLCVVVYDGWREGDLEEWESMRDVEGRSDGVTEIRVRE